MPADSTVAARPGGHRRIPAALYATAGNYLPVLAAVGGLCLLAAAGILARASTPPPADHAGVRPSRTATGTDNAYISNP